MNTQTDLSSPVTTIPPVANAILAVIQGYGYSENEGSARRQQRAVALVLQGHFTARDLALNAHSLPVVTRFHVRSGTGEGHYYVSKTPNEPGAYDCTCPDRFLPATCKHRYGAALIQDALTLAHQHRLDIPAYRRTLRTLPAVLPSHPFGSHEIAALQVLLNTTEIYDALAQEAARQFYGANQSYASTCFNAMVDKAHWAYGAGYGGVMEGHVGTIRSVLAGRPVIGLRWEPLELRWYVVGEEGGEDTGATHASCTRTFRNGGPAAFTKTRQMPSPPTSGSRARRNPTTTMPYHPTTTPRRTL